jgi:hypothetical protein
MVVARRMGGWAHPIAAASSASATIEVVLRMLDIIITGALAAAGLWLVHRFLSYAEDRGWIYYRKKRGSYGGLGVTSDFLNMYDPSRKHLQQVVREGEWKREEDDDGDDPRG